MRPAPVRSPFPLSPFNTPPLLSYSSPNEQIHVTKRDLFYTDVKLFEDQSQSDSVLDDMACMLGCTRSSLHGKSLSSLQSYPSSSPLAGSDTTPLTCVACC